MTEYMPPQQVMRGVLQASFGRVVSDEELISYHTSWNVLRHKFELPTCKFKAEWIHSGCRSPLCPQCGVRARRNVCMAILSWSHAHPDSPMSILDYTVASPESLDFNLLFKQKVIRQMTGRPREKSKAIAFITTCGYVPHIEGQEQYWVHRRTAVLLHAPEGRLPRRRGSDGGFDGVASVQLQHCHLADLRADPKISKEWDRYNNRELVIGSLLRRYPKLSTLYRKDAPSAEELLTELNSGDYRFYRTQSVNSEEML